jgi:hypothetical protein
MFTIHPSDTLKLTAKQWREINPDLKAFEKGRYYLLRQELSNACLVTVEIVGPTNALKTKP